MSKRRPCIRCGEEGEFYPKARKCKKCIIELSSTYNKENKEARWKIQLKHNYGITPEQYWSMMAQQNNRCATCGAVPPENGKLDLDHDHACCPGARSCGKCLRGFLCRPCNQALGLIRDNPDTLQAMIKYLGR